MNILQNIILPSSGLALPESLYVRHENGRQIFNTFFNVLNVQKIKAHCSISDLSLKLEGEGSFEVIVWGSQDLVQSEIVLRIRFAPDTGKVFALPWSNCRHHYLYLEVISGPGAKVRNLSFVTSTPVVNNVRLGATIVHFNRKEWVLPALERLKVGLLDDPSYVEKISVVVIDNSQNITESEANGVKVIKNKNLGGSGGFTRGLLHFKDLQFSHSLFMDDDASCEVESLKRTWALLSYSKTPKFAVAGSLLLDDAPEFLYEKGAIFEGTNIAISGGFDMTNPMELAIVENESLKPNYGGWWFFAFKISDISRFPFPFFVRGDDLMFSLMNKFNIYTTNGIACWGDDFATKAAPMPCYLDGRSLLLNNIVSCKNGVLRTLVYLSRHFMLHQFLFNYATVRAIRQSLSDTTLGVKFWKANIDTTALRSEIASYSQLEKMQPINLADYSYDEVAADSHRAVRGEKPSLGLGILFKALLLNGAFLPDFMMKKNYLLVPKGKYAVLKSAFRYNKFICYDSKTSTGYIATLNRKLMIEETFLFLGLCLKVLIHRKKYRQELESAVKLYSTESFWRSIYLER